MTLVFPLGGSLTTTLISILLSTWYATLFAMMLKTLPSLFIFCSMYTDLAMNRCFSYHLCITVSEVNKEQA